MIATVPPKENELYFENTALMKKMSVIVFSSALLLMGSCTNSELKTEVKVQLSDNEYLYYVYDGYFDESQGQTIEAADPKLIAELRAEMEPSKEEAIKVLAKRIEAAADPVPALAGLFNRLSVTRVTGEEPNSWVITINRKVDSERIKMLLEASPHGGFFETYEAKDLWEYFSNINTFVRENNIMAALNMDPDTTEFGAENPLFMILRPSVNSDGVYREGSEIGLASEKDKDLLNNVFLIPPISAQLPRDLVLIWSHNTPFNDEGYFGLHAIKATRDGKPVLSREYMVEAVVDKKSYSPGVEIYLNAEGAAIASNMTRENMGKNIAFVMNDEVYFSARVNQEITSGKMSIYADFEGREAEDFAIVMGSGYMPPFGVKVLDIKY